MFMAFLVLFTKVTHDTSECLLYTLLWAALFLWVSLRQEEKRPMKIRGQL